MRNVVDKSCRENHNTQFCSRTLSESRAVCEIMWISNVETYGPQMTIWHMRFACWVTNVANSEYVSPYCLAIATMVMQLLSFLYRAIVLDIQIIKPTICTNVLF
jgi:hypothetical protein